MQRQLFKFAMEFFVRNSFWCVVCYAVMASVSALTQNETISMASNSLADEPNAMRRGRCMQSNLNVCAIFLDAFGQS